MRCELQRLVISTEDELTGILPEKLKAYRKMEKELLQRSPGNEEQGRQRRWSHERRGQERGMGEGRWGHGNGDMPPGM